MTHRTDLPCNLELVRLSLFVDDLPPSAGGGWFAQVSGEDAEESTSKRTLGETNEQGAFLGHRLLLVKNTLSKRIDWVLHPSPTIEDGFPSLGEYSEWQNKFSEALQSWIESAGLEVTRVAYGANLLVPVGERSEGYAFLRDALPMIRFDDGWTDFTFQVNKRRKIDTLVGSPFEGLEMNCLSKWSSVELRLIPTDISVGPPPPMFAGRLELDLNSIGEDRGRKDSGTVLKIIQAMRDITVRFAKEGCIS